MNEKQKEKIMKSFIEWIAQEYETSLENQMTKQLKIISNKADELAIDPGNQEKETSLAFHIQEYRRTKESLDILYEGSEPIEAFEEIWNDLNRGTKKNEN